MYYKYLYSSSWSVVFSLNMLKSNPGMLWCCVCLLLNFLRTLASIVPFDIEFRDLIMHHVKIFASIIIVLPVFLYWEDKYKQHMTFYQTFSLNESIRESRRSELELDEDISLLLNFDLQLVEILALHLGMA